MATATFKGHSLMGFTGNSSGSSTMFMEEGQAATTSAVTCALSSVTGLFSLKKTPGVKQPIVNAAAIMWVRTCHDVEKGHWWQWMCAPFLLPPLNAVKMWRLLVNAMLTAALDIPRWGSSTFSTNYRFVFSLQNQWLIQIEHVSVNKILSNLQNSLWFVCPHLISSEMINILWYQVCRSN